MHRLSALAVLIFISSTAFPQACPPPSKRTPACSHKHSTPAPAADNSRSDTIDVLKYTITLNITDFVTDTIRGNCKVRFTPLVNNVNTISLDLLRLTIDSIEISNSNLTFTYNDTLIIVNLPVTHNTGDTSDLTVYYKGPPQGDPSGWGGWYSSNNGYIYNLGVGFAADPHNYGRVWFPCFDNFVERSKYEFIITTNNPKVAYCNGNLAHDTTIGISRTRRWVMNEEIPTYLASVAVASYTQVNWTFNGINGPIPVVLTAVPSDTVSMKNSFTNLDSALSIFERRYGPYRWNRIGYCLVPFSSGAMEHATNIAYPQLAANGTLTFEDLMAHEFSHHWWGDLATCRTAGDMWINEGMAVYSEFIFMEGMYGPNSYLSNVKSNHENVIHYIHITEGGYRAISGVPHAYTYGDHTYQKGADVAHTMRGYLGDSLFFLGLKYIQNNYQYKDIDAIDFRDAMTTATGYNMNDFFSGWVMNPGFPHFSIDSMKSVPSGNNFDVTVYVKQKLTGAPAYFDNVPLEVRFRSSGWAEEIRTLVMSGASASFTFTLPFNPVFAGMNVGMKISDAKTVDYKVLKTTGFHFATGSNARMRVSVQNSSITTDSALIFIEHNWTAPDPYLSWGIPYRLTPARYWKVSGVFPPTFDATAQVTYDGRNITSGGGGHLDNGLLVTNNLEDSVVLMYRQNTNSDWQEFPWYSKTINTPTDKFGNITIDSLIPGEYTIGRHDYLMGLPPVQDEPGQLVIYPNPSSGEAVIESDLTGPGELIILDVNGKAVYRNFTNTGTVPVHTETWPGGVYLVKWKSSAKVFTGRLVVIH